MADDGPLCWLHYIFACTITMIMESFIKSNFTLFINYKLSYLQIAIGFLVAGDL
jgi:hypothetical protein